MKVYILFGYDSYLEDYPVVLDIFLTRDLAYKDLLDYQSKGVWVHLDIAEYEVIE